MTIKLKKPKKYAVAKKATMLAAFGLMGSLPLAKGNDELIKLEKDPGQWVMQNKNYANMRFSELTQINTKNVSRLRLAWSFSTGALRGHEGGPLVVGSTMYVHSAYPNHVYALDLTQKPYAIKWQYTPVQNSQAVAVACCDVVNRGLAYANGKLFLATLDGQIIALDANTGKELWKAKHADVTKGETITGAPLVVKDKVLVGVSGGEFGVRGRVGAYDINTGNRVWLAYSQGPDEEILLDSDFNKEFPQHGGPGDGTKTWPGEQWKLGGGTTWGWYSYDPALDLFYYGTSNPGTWNAEQRKGGDNKWSCSIFARRPDTGKARWAYQMTPWDAWDYDGVNEMILPDLTVKGKKTPCLVHFDRNGFCYVLDRRTGELIEAHPFVYVNWAKEISKENDRPVEVPEKRTKQGVDTKGICPNAMGGKDQQPAAYNPQTGLFYVPTNNMCMNYEGVEATYTAGAPYVGANVLMYSGHEGKDDYYGAFICYDALKGKRVWEIHERFPVWSGPVVTAGGLAFYGTMDGWFKAVDIKTGKVLWQQKLGSGIIGNPITFLGPDKKQYVAVYSGVGGWFGIAVAQNLPPDDPYAGLGAVGVAYQAGLPKATTIGGELYVFSLE
ncbi:methanol/ethanol family PQQ-dependent dehydrogenase [Candidatus Methylacidiphilum infernorum]|uniref:Methanol/ethanol family PQQ-dependent dehydrogenase n=1 Tax=Candidatus Methylacidiphilum infernorum TaxID=511746 RepID=A0ABX7PVQ1_9BACT|nr:methanol/ethanol family PQQ-dependent dehydrogenase [Candidatus Methylacidiphilum infernorum]QSR86718.1 methanol/ethanol family PQQ-dependent dehydrogenase [Candidatus Methylacidiphilum infernorum]